MSQRIIAGSLLLCVAGCALLSKNSQDCPPWNPIVALDLSPSWSPEARFVAYQHGRGQAQDTVGLYIADTSGSAPRLLVSGDFLFSSARLAWSPDGTQIAFYNGDIWTVRVADLTLHPWTSNAPFCYDPTWSPDGRWILYEVGARRYGEPDSVSGLHLIDTSTGAQRALFHNDSLATWGSQPSWAPDGKTIAFTVYENQGNTSAIYVVGPDGKNYRRLLKSAGYSENPQWSEDGSQLFFDFTPAPCPAGESALTSTWVVNADGSGLRRWPINLGGTRVQFAFPFRLSRVRQRVTFVGLDQTGKRGVIWAMNLDGSDRRQITSP